MRRSHLQVQKLALAAVLTATSVVIDVFFKQLMGIQNFGVPFYAVPIIMGSIILGPHYGVLMSLVSDAVGVTIAGQGYLISFAIAPIMWGLIPGLFLYKRYSLYRLAYVIPLTYLFASLSNTLAMFIEFGRETTIATLAIRVIFIPLNSIIMFYVIKDVYLRLTPFHEKFTLKQSPINN
ncbi:MAG: folate family ECF transporter S component [Acholeplasmataceae bacterium]|jgi:ECF transporter S component (folate family)|nr:folate family ECF transporter S component [Acholeplasmataceae bacterium]